MAPRAYAFKTMTADDLPMIRDYFFMVRDA